MDTEQTVEQKRAIWQRVNPTLQPYPAEADAVNVCCMGVNAREDVEVIQGFIEEELADRRSYLTCAGMAPNAAAQLCVPAGPSTTESGKNTGIWCATI